MIFKSNGTLLLNLSYIKKKNYNAKLHTFPHKNYFQTGHRLFKSNSHHVDVNSIMYRSYIYFTPNPKLVPRH